MKKRILSIAVFSVLFLITFSYLNKAFSSESHYINTIEDFKKLSKKTNIDLLFYGSSHSYTAYNPAVFNKNCNTVSYNLGSDGLRMCFTDLVLEESLKYTTPKLIVLEIYDGSLTFPKTDRAKGYQLRALDFVPNYSTSKWKKISEVYGEDDYLSIAFPVIRNHHKWNKVNYLNISRRQELDTSEQVFYQGFIGTKRILQKDDKIKHQGFKDVIIKKDSSRSRFNATSKKNLSNFLNIAKKHNIPVMVVTSPDSRIPFKENNYLYDELGEFCKNNNVGYLNLNEYYEEMQLSIADFRDPAHLNLSGAAKASQFLADFINKQYSLPNRSKEDVWKQSLTHDGMFTYDTKPKKIYENFEQKQLLEEAIIDSIVVERMNTTYEVRIKFKKFDLQKNQFRLGLRMYPVEEEMHLINERNKSKKLKFDQGNIIISKMEEEGAIVVKSNIKTIEKLAVFLYDANKYSGVIGKKIWYKVK